jgi:hypothetical protein
VRLAVVEEGLGGDAGSVGCALFGVMDGADEGVDVASGVWAADRARALTRDERELGGGVQER